MVFSDPQENRGLLGPSGTEIVKMILPHYKALPGRATGAVVRRASMPLRVHVKNNQNRFSLSAHIVVYFSFATHGGQSVCLCWST